MSVAAHHNDWLTLVEVSGPFLSLPVLMDALPGGVDKPDRDLVADLWRAYSEWTDEDAGGAADAAVHDAWIRYVIEHVLGHDSDVLVRAEDLLVRWSVEVPEHDATLRPTFAITDTEDADGPALLLVDVQPPDVSVTEPASASGWSASPAERMEALLQSVDARIGLVTNGEQWTLVNTAEGANSGFATWYASLWREEQLTLRAFTTLLGMRRFFAVADEETLQALLDRSREDQQGVTTQLGKQVRQAIEILVQQIDRVDHDRGGRLLAGMTEQRLYEAAVTVMMRLIFLFYAEENDLLLLGDDFYDGTYAASTLREQLQATADENGEEILERFHDAWPRLLSTFRAVYAGVEHEQMRLPAYGGALFDPDRYPFVEGREPGTSWLDVPADPLPIDNRTVLHLLNAIQTLRVKVPGGGRENRPLSFRALDVEQIGHVYETLLDHTAVRADDWVFGLEGTKDKEPEVLLRELEARADDQTKLVKYLADETGRSAGALKKRVAAEETVVYDRWGHRWKPAFGGDEQAAATATKWGLLLREDSAESPVVVPPGHVYVTESEQRRSSGTHYTPRSLTEEIVTHTLEPLVYQGPTEGHDRSDWQLRTPEEILDLAVCDPACGSGAFLVQACRYLAERLVEAWTEHVVSDGPDGHALPTAPEERLVVARRYVADRCLYGVDINALATEMAKLSLWLITLQRSRPFTFLDHAIRTGDSLVGVSNFETLEVFGVSKGQIQLWSQSWAPQLKAAREAREELRSFSVIDAKDADHKRTLLDAAATHLEDLRLVADAIAGLQLASSALNKNATEPLRREVGRMLEGAFGQGASKDRDELAAKVRELLDTDLPSGDSSRVPFHWVLEFPEVFIGAEGFHALVGNPPFVRGRSIASAMGKAYRETLVRDLAHGKRGPADYIAYFFLRATSLAREGGRAGLVATNSISEGDTREVGLDQMFEDGWRIVRAVKSEPWPGNATVHIAKVWLRRGEESRELQILDGRPVTTAISPMLLPASRVQGSPRRLQANRGLSFKGSEVYGDGFVLTENEANELLSADQRYQDVVFPYLSGADLNRSPGARPTRWVINFFDWPLERASEYPLALERVRKLVKPMRDRTKRKARRERWWQYGEKAVSLYEGLEQLEGRALGIAYTSSTLMPIPVETDYVFTNGVCVLLCDDLSDYAALASALHWAWALRYSSSLGAGRRYAPSDCFETFPRCGPTPELRSVGSDMADLLADVMGDLDCGLTEVYSLMSSAKPTAESLALRAAQERLDVEVAAAYGWSDLNFSYSLRETEVGVRWTVDQSLERELLDRLLERNLELETVG